MVIMKLISNQFPTNGGINMEIKKCINCGSFISSDATLCSTCANKITYENTVLKNFFDENASFDSIPSISAVTGIAPSAVQRFMISNNYIDTNADSSGFSPIQY